MHTQSRVGAEWGCTLDDVNAHGNEADVDHEVYVSFENHVQMSDRLNHLTTTFSRQSNDAQLMQLIAQHSLASAGCSQVIVH